MEMLLECARLHEGDGLVVKCMTVKTYYRSTGEHIMMEKSHGRGMDN